MLPRNYPTQPPCLRIVNENRKCEFTQRRSMRWIVTMPPWNPRQHLIPTSLTAFKPCSTGSPVKLGSLILWMISNNCSDRNSLLRNERIRVPTNRIITHSSTTYLPMAILASTRMPIKPMRIPAPISDSANLLASPTYRQEA